MEIWRRISARKRSRRDSQPFEAWVTRPPAPGDTLRPLLVVVHPGDALEALWNHPHGPGRSALAASLRSQGAMAEEASAMLDAGWDAAVLHRRSCADFEEYAGLRPVSEAMRGILARIHATGSTGYGDALDAAGAWLGDGLRAASRPATRVMGAYLDEAGHGCVNAVTDALRRMAADGSAVTASPASYRG